MTKRKNYPIQSAFTPIQSSIKPFGFFGGNLDNVIDYMLDDFVSNRNSYLKS